MLIYLHAVEGPENRVKHRKIDKLYFFFWKTGLNVHEIISILEEGPQPNVIANVTLIPDSNEIITGRTVRRRRIYPRHGDGHQLLRLGAPVTCGGA